MANSPHTGNAQEDTICLIIAADSQRGLPAPTFEAALTSALRSNPDGIGLAWPDGGQVRIRKHARQYAPVLEQALALYAGTTLPFFIHLRHNTVGSTSGGNTHPFALAPGLAMAHNKTLAIQPPHRHWSDSRTVAELLKTLIAGDPSFFGSPLFWSFIEHQADADNRFVFLEAESQELLIINDHLGVDVDGIWFSNLYAWDPGTAGLRRASRLHMDMAGDQADADWDRWGVDDPGDDLPLVWGSARVDRRELAPRAGRCR
jgi:hypothetical protein